MRYAIRRSPNTYYKRYVKIFERKEGKPFGMPISIITDLDVRSIEYYQDTNNKSKMSVYRVTDDIKVAMEAFKDRVAIDKLPSFFKTEAAIDDFISDNKLKKTVGGKVKEKIKLILTQTQEDITCDDIEKMRAEKRSKLTATYNGEIKLFFPLKWTLEYEIANSKLHNLLEVAIELAKKDETSNGDKEITDIIEQIGAIDVTTAVDSVKAYQIFKPLNDGTVSKAITAQYFSQLLEDFDDKDKLNNLISSDSYLSYIVEAINHVTQ